MNNAFLTGSYAYGTPTAESDIDLVVLMSKDEFDRFTHIAGHCWMEKYGDLPCSDSLRFGNLNVIATHSPDFFQAWKDGTAEMIAAKPVTRDQAVVAIKALMANYGLTAPVPNLEKAKC